ncbi:hypothetical protein Tco_0714755 [Tanacetum coccineum]
MADNRIMAQLLQAPTEGYEDAIVIPEINANFELKHALINLVQNKQDGLVQLDQCPESCQDMKDTTGASGSSGTPSTVEKSLLDFADEDLPPPNTEGVAAIGPLVHKRRHKRGNDEADANAPPKVLRKDHVAFCPAQSTIGGKSLATMGKAASSTITPVAQDTLVQVFQEDGSRGRPGLGDVYLLYIHGRVARKCISARVIPQTTVISNIKLPILKKEYDIWAMEMEHYLEYIDNDVWKVIQNGNSKKRISTGKDGIVRILSPVTAAEIQAVEKERKAKNILLMAIPKEHMRRFHGMDDAKEINLDTINHQFTLIFITNSRI